MMINTLLEKDPNGIGRGQTQAGKDSLGLFF
jgi:hypothetical protein